MANIFSHIPLPKLKYSKFNLSYDNAFTAKFGELLPCYLEEVVPGDRFTIGAAPFVRCSPMSAPILGRLNATIHYFYVPYRIIWDNWYKFITGGRLGLDSPKVPHFLPAQDSIYHRLFDFLSMERTSLDGKSSTRPEVVGLAWRAYWKIFSDYYRDQNLMPDLFDDTNSVYISTGDGLISDLPGFRWSFFGSDNDISSPQFRAWKKDLFTSALPWAQRGEPVTVPVTGIAGREIVEFYRNTGTGLGDVLSASTDSSGAVSLKTVSGSASSSGYLGTSVAAADRSGYVDVEELWNSMDIQRWLIRNAVGGARDVEQILAHFGVTVPDYRLARPEFLSGVRVPFLTSDVTQTSETNTSSVLGTLGGRGVAAGSMVPRKYRVPEHGVIMGIFSITPDAVYSQGVRRQHLKFDKFDHFFPEFQNLGEQEVYNDELFAQGSPESEGVHGHGTFGYAPRYYEYKSRTNEVHGLYRSSKAYWLPQRLFQSLPGLNKEFVQVNPGLETSLNNIFAIVDDSADNQPFDVVVSNVVSAVRPMNKLVRFNF